MHADIFIRTLLKCWSLWVFRTCRRNTIDKNDLSDTLNG